MKLETVGYVRDGVRKLPVARQTTLLERTLPGLRIHRDALDMQAIRSHSADPLRQRRTLLVPSSPLAGGVMIVASFRCFALDPVDLTVTAADAAAAGVTIRSLKDGMDLTPRAGIAEIAKAMAAWKQSKMIERTEDGWQRGAARSMANRRSRNHGPLAVAEPLWRLSPDEISNAEIADRVGLTVRSLYNHFGRRGPCGQAADEADPMVERVATALAAAGIDHVRSPRPIGLDFHLLDRNTYVDCLPEASAAAAERMRRARNVIVIQGDQAAAAFAEMIAAVDAPMTAAGRHLESAEDRAGGGFADTIRDRKRALEREHTA